MEWERYRKAIAAVAAAVVQLIAVWQEAPPWVIGLVPILGAIAVWAVPNDPQPHDHT